MLHFIHEGIFPCEISNNNLRCDALYVTYYQFIVCFPTGLDFLSITFFLHFFLSWTTSLSISISAMPFYSLYPCSSWSSYLSSAFNPIFHTFLHPILITFRHHMSIPSLPTTSNDSCDRLSSNQLSQWKHHTSI